MSINDLYGIGEASLSAGTGLLANIPAGLAGLATMIAQQDP